MRIMKPVSAMLLSLILMVTAQGMAFARTQAPADGQMVLCTGHGSFIVYVDEDGQPTTAPQLCSDAAQAFFSAVLDVLAVAYAPMARAFSVDIPAPIDWAGIAARVGSARGPPVG